MTELTTFELHLLIEKKDRQIEQLTALNTHYLDLLNQARHRENDYLLSTKEERMEANELYYRRLDTEAREMIGKSLLLYQEQEIELKKEIEELYEKIDQLYEDIGNLTQEIS